jgi:tRNA(Ile)-lysidine synthase
LSDGRSLTTALFADLMTPLGPFESEPVLAVGVSGGADSMALILLAAEWAKGRGGQAIALTVDHRLRDASAREALTVGKWLAARAIPHRILPWLDQEPHADGLQAAARRARYRLLGDWCRAHHVMHLLVAHHRDDQAETLLLRLARGSGVDGLAAMEPAALLPHLQILRPFLPMPRDALRDYLSTRRQDWLEDPSNDALRFDRVRWRKIVAAQSIPTQRLAVTATQMGRARHALELAATDLAVAAVRIHPAGFAWLDPAILRTAPAELGLRLLAHLTRTVGGQLFPPRLAGLETLWEMIAGQGLTKRRSLAGCLVTPQDGRILLSRENRALAPPVRLRAGDWTVWDRRFSVLSRSDGDFWLGAAGAAGAKLCRSLANRSEIPPHCLASLPVIMDKRGILAVPPVGYGIVGCGVVLERWGFTPSFPLAGAAFRLVTPVKSTM